MAANLPRFWWFERGEIHFDAALYARLREIPLEQAIGELTELIRELLPGVPIHEP
jgi:hypothetical protein